MFVHALSGAASFAACLELFRSYPLAVNRPDFRDHGHGHSQGRCSIVLRHPGFEGNGYYVLTQDPADRFTLRPWHTGDGEVPGDHPRAPGLGGQPPGDLRGHAGAAGGSVARLGE